MKRNYWIAVSVCLSLILIAGISATVFFCVNDNCAPVEKYPRFVTEGVSQDRLITVSGTGSVKVKPDVAILNIGVTSTGEKSSVQEENTKTMDKILAVVKELGVAEKDIMTTSYYMNPNYDYDYGYRKDGRSQIVGYTVYNMIEVKVRDIDKAGSVLSAAVDAGANVNNGISFTLSDFSGVYNQALEKAINDGTEKAKTMAKAASVSIGAPFSMSEGYSYSPTGNYNSRASYDSVNYAEMAASPPVAVEAGELEIVASVNMSFDY